MKSSNYITLFLKNIGIKHEFGIAGIHLCSAFLIMSNFELFKIVPLIS